MSVNLEAARSCAHSRTWSNCDYRCDDSLSQHDRLFACVRSNNIVRSTAPYVIVLRVNRKGTNCSVMYYCNLYGELEVCEDEEFGGIWWIAFAGAGAAVAVAVTIPISTLK